jgi:hypothetical protein
MASVYLHIGAPKTGTSSLQHALASAGDALLEHRVLYPGSCRHGNAHHVLVCDLIDRYQPRPMPGVWYGDYPRGQAWESLRLELAAREGQFDSVVISSELFFGQSHNLDRMLAEIEHSLVGHQVKVIVYLRRQDQLYSSFYNQDVKGARQWPHSAYEFYETHQIFRRDYYQLVSIWARAFGREHIVVRPFEPAQWGGGDTIDDFCALLGIPPIPGVEDERNEGLGPNQLYIKRCLNRVGFDKPRNDRVVELVQHLCPEAPGGDTLYINRGLYNRYRRNWEEANQRVARDYLGQERLFHSEIPDPDDLQRYTTSVAGLAAFIGRLSEEGERGGLADLRQLFARAAVYMIADSSLWEKIEPGWIDTFNRWSLEGS